MHDDLVPSRRSEVRVYLVGRGLAEVFDSRGVALLSRGKWLAHTHTHKRTHFYVLSSEGAFFISLRQSKKTRLEGGDLRISVTFILLMNDCC